MKHNHQRRRAAVIVMAALLLASGLAVSPGAEAAGDYSSPNWLPVRGVHRVGCAHNSLGPVCGGNYHGNWALDIGMARGESVYAAGAGKVVRVVTGQGRNCNAERVRRPADCPDGSRGNSVTIDHGGGVSTYYQHLSSVAVPEGRMVDQNTVLGGAGDSGYSTPGYVHLHYERRQGSSAVDPGALKACVGGALRTYPQAFGSGITTWYGLRGHTHDVNSEGTACGGRPSTGGGGGGSGRPAVDLVFVVDTTGSMGPHISAVRASATAIATLLFTVADARIAVVEYKDLHSGCSSDGFASRVVTGFTNNTGTWTGAVGSLGATGGCDFPESVYSGLMTGLELPWRSGAAKSLIVMGDAPPHDPEPVTGYTRSAVVNRARTAGVTIPTLPSARSVGVTSAAAVGDAENKGASIYTIDIYGEGGPDFESLAEETGGRHYVATDPDSVVEQIVEAIATITDSAVVADAGGPYSGVVGEPITFDASLSAATAAILSYEWDVDGNGVYDRTTTLPSLSHVYSAPHSGSIGVRITTADDPPVTAATVAAVDIRHGSSVAILGPRAANNKKPVRVQAKVSGPLGQSPVGAPVLFTVGGLTCSTTSGPGGVARCDIDARSLPPGDHVVEAVASPADLFPSGGIGTVRLSR